VSEYITAALLCLGQRHGIRMEGRTIGVIGVGNVGSRVVRKARALGMRVLMNDPPRERAERGPARTAGGKAGGSLESDSFVSLDTILAEADVITVHVPLTKDGPDRTLHLADAAFFAKARKGCLFLNAARGPVVETDALLKALATGQVSHVVLDTWEGEPRYRVDMLEKADLGSPHIAGHSFEGKAMGTVMVYREACRFLGVEPTWSHEPLMPVPSTPEIRVEAKGRSDEAVLWEIVRRVYDIEADDRRLRETAGLDANQRAKQFDQLRRDYPERREFQYTRVIVPDAKLALRDKLKGLGFK
jgi:erythronate-4-phosphate dehydrogenase